MLFLRNSWDKFYFILFFVTKRSTFYSYFRNNNNNTWSKHPSWHMFCHLWLAYMPMPLTLTVLHWYYYAALWSTMKWRQSFQGKYFNPTVIILKFYFPRKLSFFFFLKKGFLISWYYSVKRIIIWLILIIINDEWKEKKKKEWWSFPRK